VLVVNVAFEEFNVCRGSGSSDKSACSCSSFLNIVKMQWVRQSDGAGIRITIGLYIHCWWWRHDAFREMKLVRGLNTVGWRPGATAQGGAEFQSNVAETMVLEDIIDDIANFRRRIQSTNEIGLSLIGISNETMRAYGVIIVEYGIEIPVTLHSR